MMHSLRRTLVRSAQHWTGRWSEWHNRQWLKNKSLKKYF